MTSAVPSVEPIDERRTSSRSDPRLRPGSRIGDYRVERLIAEGGMGDVYAGIHPVIRKRVAIKVLRSRFASDTQAVRRFVLEARAVNQIGHHSFVDIFAIGTLDDGRNYLIMEMLDGLGLHEILARVGRFEPQLLLPLFAQLTDALEAAHREGFVHRDLKPDNVIVLRRPPYPTIKVLDFGVAKLRTRGPRDQTHAGAVLGTPEYMAPEQCRGLEVDVRTDVYATGVMLYELLTGKKPFSDPDPLRVLAQQVRHAPAPPSRYVTIDPEVEQTVLRAMAKAPEDRFASARELYAALCRTVGPARPWHAGLAHPPAGLALAPTLPALAPTLPPEALESSQTTAAEGALSARGPRAITGRRTTPWTGLEAVPTTLHRTSAGAERSGSNPAPRAEPPTTPFARVPTTEQRERTVRQAPADATPTGEFRAAPARDERRPPDEPRHPARDEIVSSFELLISPAAADTAETPDSEPRTMIGSEPVIEAEPPTAALAPQRAADAAIARAAQRREAGLPELYRAPRLRPVVVAMLWLTALASVALAGLLWLGSQLG